MWNPETNIRGPVGPPGPPGVSTSRFFYRKDNSTAAGNPGDGRYRYNNTIQGPACTALYFSNVTQDNFDVTALFMLSGIDDDIVLQDKNLAADYQHWRLTGPAVMHAGWFEVPVEYVDGSGVVFTGNADVAALVRSAGVIGPEGPPGPIGPEGPTGPPGLSGAIVSDTPPPSTVLGSFWYESDTGLLYIRYQDPDGSSTPWVAVSGATSGGPMGLTGPQGPKGDTGAASTVPGPPGDLSQSVADTLYVKYTAAQALSAAQQTQARANILAAQQLATPDVNWRPIPYESGWADYGAPFGPCGFRKLSNGLVMCKGICQGGTATNIFTFPVGYRPGFQVLLIAETSPNAACRLDITTGGLLTHTGGSNGWLSLNNVIFLAEG